LDRFYDLNLDGLSEVAWTEEPEASENQSDDENKKDPLLQYEADAMLYGSSVIAAVKHDNKVSLHLQRRKV